MLERLATETFDVLVVGGGVTGAGVAVDAATRGLRTALVEAADFASGTSSKSSKLVHGGPALPPAGRRAAGLRGAPRAPAAAPQRPAPRQAAAVHDPDPDQGRPDPPPGGPGPRLGDVDVRPHGRLPHRQVPQAPQGRRRVRPPADDAPRAPRRRLPLLRRDHRRRPARAHARPHRRRPRRRRRQPLPGRRAHEGRRRAGRRGHRRHRRPAHRRAADGRRQRGRRLGRRGADDGGRRRRPTRSAPPRAST